MKTATIYIAFDDTAFKSSEECKAYEAKHIEMRLVGLTIEQVRSGLSREDTDLADAIEDLGNRIAKARREAGDMRRKKAPETERAPTPEKIVEDKGREAFRSGCEREPPDDVAQSMIGFWLIGYDYERTASKRAA